MKKIFVFFIYLSLSVNLFAQNYSESYPSLIGKAEELYQKKDYKASANSYSEAFKSNGWKGSGDDRYNAACSWALAGNIDSAFYNLQRITDKLHYRDYDHIINDEDLISLHNDNRWELLITAIKVNKEEAEKNLNNPLAHELDSIFDEDQNQRLMIDEYESKYGNDSKEMKALWDIIQKKDSSNIIRVTQILDNYGWLGHDIVGDKGNSCLFLVIQHANLETQEKYLPMMKDAVSKGKANASSLALLIDRIEMRHGRPQIYGSQITFKDGKNVIYTIIDEKNVDKRRSEVGLDPLENYAKHWNIDYHLPDK